MLRLVVLKWALLQVKGVILTKNLIGILPSILKLTTCNDAEGSAKMENSSSLHAHKKFFFLRHFYCKVFLKRKP
jgi:hypothetical protein